YPGVEIDLNRLVYGVASQFLSKGQPVEAFEIMDAAQREFQALALPAELWNNVCWKGSLLGVDSARAVTHACEIAVKLEPSPGIRDSRAVNRALLGDLAGAIEDFQVFIKGTPDRRKAAQRQGY